MKESKWFSTVVVVVLFGINGISFLFMHSNEVSPKISVSLLVGLIVATFMYVAYLNRSRFKSRKSRQSVEADD